MAQEMKLTEKVDFCPLTLQRLVVTLCTAKLNILKTAFFHTACVSVHYKCCNKLAILSSHNLNHFFLKIKHTATCVSIS